MANLQLVKVGQALDAGNLVAVQIQTAKVGATSQAFYMCDFVLCEP